MTHHDLDNAIGEALKRLAQPTSVGNFDYQKYIAAFRESAQKKAAATLAELASPKSPFRDLRPVFVSIGGGDGEELINLLRDGPKTRSHGKAQILQFGHSLRLFGPAGP